MNATASNRNRGGLEKCDSVLNAERQVVQEKEKKSIGGCTKREGEIERTNRRAGGRRGGRAAMERCSSVEIRRSYRLRQEEETRPIKELRRPARI